jgi:primosomal protein N' (replication factor Y)
MYFYEVWVRSASYRGQEALTYQSERQLPIGTIVSVPLQRAQVGGVVVRKAAKPAFATKSLTVTEPALALPPVLLELGRHLITFYASPLGVITQLLVPANTDIANPELPPVVSPRIDTLPTLTDEQRLALPKLRGTGAHLLHGTTGSGKTRVYIELALTQFAAGRSSIILTPEISLTSQLAEQFDAVFGAAVTVLHSGLTPKERRQAWARVARTKSPQIIIGARSALFSPVDNVGLIVIDEAHEPAYKQETAPYYHASYVAGILARLHKATLVLGSATPSVIDYYVAEQKNIPIVTLSQLATTSQTSLQRHVVDATDRSLFVRSPYLSEPLLAAINNSLKQHEQGMLYLNKRGTSRTILCDNCGWRASCPRCDLPLTYHADSHQTICHSCSFRGSAPMACPECGNTSIIYRSAGTKLITDEVSRLFPEARVQRFDTDNLKAERLEHHYQALRRGEIDILVGTQLLAKGLDLPRLSTVGVVDASSSLSVPDFTSQERTYQLLVQVLGRIGRGHRDSTAIVQTYNPKSLAIQAALGNDWPAFYAAEISERQQFMFPPFCFLLKLTCKRSSSHSAENAAGKLKLQLEQRGKPVRIEGPAPAFHEKAAGKYQWQLIVKAKRRQDLLDIIAALPSSGWSYDIDPINLL